MGDGAREEAVDALDPWRGENARIAGVKQSRDLIRGAPDGGCRGHDLGSHALLANTARGELTFIHGHENAQRRHSAQGGAWGEWIAILSRTPSSRAPAEAGASILDKIEAASPIMFEHPTIRRLTLSCRHQLSA
jgi:hypothetical protein